MKNFLKFCILSLASACLACSGVAFSPSHVGHYTFSGQVIDAAGKPVKDASVKVLGWETLTDAQGRWRVDQLVECGASHDNMSAYTQKDVILVYADGYEPVEHGFTVERAAWFASCPEEKQEYSFNSILRKEGSPQNSKTGNVVESRDDSGSNSKEPQESQEQNDGVAL